MFYINHATDGIRLPMLGKGEMLVSLDEAEEVLADYAYESVPPDKAICIEVDNDEFSALALMHDEGTYDWCRQDDGRARHFYLVDKEFAHRVSGLTEDEE